MCRPRSRALSVTGPSLCAIVLSALLAGATPALAQVTTGALQGAIVDAQGLSVGEVTVTALGPQGARTTTSAADGRFSVPFLTPGTYDVRAERQGFKVFERTGVAVGLGQTVNLPITMEVGGVAETVRVTAPAVGAMRSTTAGTVMSSELFQSVPVGRRLADTLYLAPGVSGSNTVGRMNPSIAGGSGLDNEYVIDGVNVTSVGYGGLGSFSSIFRSLGNATPFDFIKEVQVKTDGSDAEFGQSLGGVVNVITQSGSNDLEGSVFTNVQPHGLESSWTQVQTPNGTVQTVGSHTYDAGVTGGGPLVRDRLFYFGAIDPSRDVQTFEAPAGFPLVSQGAVNRVRDTVSYSANVTYQANGRNRFDASFFGDPSTGRNGAQSPAALLAQTTAQYSALSWGGHNQTLRYDGVLSSHWLVEASYARALNTFSETPDANTWQFRDTTVTPSVRSGGIGAYEPGNRGVSDQYAVKSTNVWGRHEVKYGFEYRPPAVEPARGLHRADVHNPGRPPDGKRRGRERRRRSDVRQDLPRHPWVPR